MEEKVKKIFNLDWIRQFAEENIDNTEWIEEDNGEKRRILVIDTLFDGSHGVYIPGMVLELFGQAEGYDLEDPNNWEKNATIYDALEYLEHEINDCLNKLIPSKGWYYMGYHESDGSYCLFYTEYEEKKRFKIHVPGITDQETIGSYEEAIEAFEEALWETRILPNEERLTAADLGLPGSISLESWLAFHGFLRYGEAYVEEQ